MGQRRGTYITLLIVASAVLLGFGPMPHAVPHEARASSGRVPAVEQHPEPTIPAVIAPCPSRDDCGRPLKGGLRITFTGWACTVAFLARDRVTGDAYALTAGHCLAASGLTALWSYGREPVGRAVAHAFRDNSNADVGAIAVDASDLSDLVVGAGDAPLPISGIAPDSSQAPGARVCRSGGISGWQCGTIVAADLTARLDGRVIRHSWWTDFPSAAGDSGSPMLDASGRAAGILVGTTPTESIYSTVGWAATELNARICLNPGCGR